MFIDDAYAHLYALCQSGLGKTSPNPNVAAAIYAADGKLISHGIHDRTSSLDHAEVLAIKAARELACGATIVISLEPCSHTGTTPPCTEAIITAGIAKVIYAVKDPNPIAAGGGEILKSAGIDVEFVLSNNLEFIQRAWLHKGRMNRPRFIWKVATTLDGKVAASDGTSQWITSEESRSDVQLLRSQSDAILVGTSTALIDNPHLIPRGYDQRPVRVIFGEREIPSTNKVFDNQAPTLVVKSRSIPELVKTLSDEGLNQVLVEAGPTLGSELFREGIIDELITYQAPKLLGSGTSFLSDLGVKTLADAWNLELISSEQIKQDIKSHYLVKGK